MFTLVFYSLRLWFCYLNAFIFCSSSGKFSAFSIKEVLCILFFFLPGWGLISHHILPSLLSLSGFFSLCSWGKIRCYFAGLWQVCGVFLCLIDTLLVLWGLKVSVMQHGSAVPPYWPSVSVCVCIFFSKTMMWTLLEYRRRTVNPFPPHLSSSLLYSWSPQTHFLCLPTLWHGPLCSDMGSSCWIIILRCYCTPTEQIFNTLRPVLHCLCCWLDERLGQTRRRTYRPNVLLSPACTSVRGLASTGNLNFYKKKILYSEIVYIYFF